MAPIAQAMAIPSKNNTVSCALSWLWNCTSGSKSPNAIQINAPAEKASAAGSNKPPVDAGSANHQKTRAARGQSEANSKFIK